MTRALMRVDVLPPKSQIEAEVDAAGNRVRFVAVRNLDTEAQRSEPSGWFSLDRDDLPIHLTWAAFDWGEE
jgi:hypothetical protein